MATANAPSSSKSDTVPTSKPTAISRFKQFAGDRLGIKTRPKIVFPPPSWQINDVSNPYIATDATNAQNDSGATAEPQEDIPEPKTFALKIRQMIESLPPSVTAAIGMGTSQQGTSHESQDGTSTGTSTAPPIDGKGPPIPENVDAKTMRLLSSENVMNGDDSGISAPSRGAHRQSVWSALEGMEPGRAPESREQVDGPPPTHPDSGIRHTEHAEKGVMLYSPLEPAADSEVEIAESREVSNPDQVNHVPPPTTMETQWVPSTTKISVLTTWWGYRLYLPPPVMATLDSSQMKATQRAAMITTALTWFLKKVPTMVIPAPMLPTVKVLRRLSPLLSYIGVFIAWSWTRISACDRGNGVVLSATWLLPVALIPMAWDAGDIYGPPLRPLSTPAESSSGRVDKASSGSENKKGQGKEKSKSRFGLP
ncbi:hypothetical protein C0993_001259 [Termitomyces sp. T159_Od127]|nr:hypothetical protein C0993_001259 [Termitomyces sp. T159_Od127]